MSHPRALLIDLDGVLRSFPDPTRFEREAGLPAGALLRAAFAPERLQPVLTGRVSDASWRQQVIEALSAAYPQAQARQAVRLWSQPGSVDAAVLELVRRVRQRAKVVLVTNATTRLAADLAELDLRRELDEVVSSAEVGAVKPEPTLYRAALERAGVGAEAALFVDDKRENVDGARALGIESLLFSDAASLERSLSDTGWL